MSICLGMTHYAKVHDIRALVVDEDTVYQDLLCRLLGLHGVQVAGRASRIGQVGLLYKAIHPDVVIVDVSSYVDDKLDALSKIKGIDPNAKFVALSILDVLEGSNHDLNGLIDAYIAKGSAAKEIVDTVKRVVLGKES